MIVLAFDTSAAHCAVAVQRGDTVLASQHEAMARGQAERLVPMIKATLGDASIALSDVDRIGVGTGPGNFTGLRIAVATARGLALALGVPAIGVTAFDAIESIKDRPGRPMVPAPRGQGYLLDETTGAPFLASENDLRDMDPSAPLLTLLLMPSTENSTKASASWKSGWPGGGLGPIAHNFVHGGA